MPGDYQIVLAIITGLFAGLIHVFSGPDHLAAVAPLASERPRGAWVTGFRWGLGHASGVLLVGVLSLLLRDVLPLESLSAASERLVGVMLIGIGIWGFRRAFSRHLHTHEHQHGGEHHSHSHIHAHAPSEHHRPTDRKSGLLAHRHTHAAFAIGTLHGLAGSSHFLGVLPALAFHTTHEAVCYLAAYGVGTVAAMTVFSSVIGWVSGRTTRGLDAYRWVMCGYSAAAVAVGGYWLAA